MLSRKIMKFTLQSTVSTRKCLVAVEQWAGLLARLQHSSNRAHFSLQHTQERYKRDFDRRLCEARDSKRTDKDEFIDVSDGLIEIPKHGHTMGAPDQLLGQDQHTVVIQRKKLVEWIIVVWVAATAWPTDVPPISPDSASALGIGDKNLKGTPWLFHRILGHYLNNDGHLEHLPKWGFDYEGIWEPLTKFWIKNSHVICFYA